MQLPLLSSCKLTTLDIRWLLYAQMESILSHKHTYQFLMVNSQTFSLWVHQFQARLIIGPDLILELKFKHSNQMITNLFLTMEENTLTKLSFLLLVSIIKVQTLKVLLRWNNLTKWRTFLFTALTNRRESIETSTTDGATYTVI